MMSLDGLAGWTGTLADRIWEVVDRARIWSKLLSRGAWVPWAGKLYHTSHAQTTPGPTLADQTLSTCFFYLGLQPAREWVGCD